MQSGKKHDDIVNEQGEEWTKVYSEGCLDAASKCPMRKFEDTDTKKFKAGYCFGYSKFNGKKMV